MNNNKDKQCQSSITEKCKERKPEFVKELTIKI